MNPAGGLLASTGTADPNLHPSVAVIAAALAAAGHVRRGSGGLKLRWGRRLAMDPNEAAEAVRVLRPRVVIPILDHDFTRLIAGLAVTTTGDVEAFDQLLRKDAAGRRGGCLAAWPPVVPVKVRGPTLGIRDESGGFWKEEDIAAIALAVIRRPMR